MIKKSGKEKLHTYTENTLAQLQLTQCQVMLFRYVYTTVLCLKTHALMPVIPVFNNADAIMLLCRRYVSRHF